MKIIYRAGNIMEAHIVAGLLQNYGINTHVSGHYLQGGIGELGVTDFSNVLIDEYDFEKALPIIASYEQASPADMPSTDADGTDTGLDRGNRD